MNGEQMTFDDILRVDPPTAPYQRHSKTSRAAAESISAGTIRQRVYEFIVSKKWYGATDQEIAAEMGLDGNTARARRVELTLPKYKIERVKDSGRTRATRSGRMAAVWISVEFQELNQ